jgi:hypothetical protein
VQSLKIAGWLPGSQASRPRAVHLWRGCVPRQQFALPIDKAFVGVIVPCQWQRARLLPQPMPTTPAARSPAPPRGSERGPALSARAGVWAHSNGSLLNLLATSGTELLSCHMRTSQNVTRHRRRSQRAHALAVHSLPCAAAACCQSHYLKVW